MKYIFIHFSLFRSYSFLSLSFPVFYFPCLLLSFFLLCLSLHISNSISPYVSFFACSLSFSSDLLCLSSIFSFCFYLSLFVFSFPCRFSSTFFLYLSSVTFHLLFSLSFWVYAFYYYPSVLLFLHFLPFIFLSAFSAYFSTFFYLFCFSYFVLFSTLFNYLVLILDFNYCNFSLIFIISINICYVFPFSLVVFFTKCELLSFFSFQHMLCGVF